MSVGGEVVDIWKWEPYHISIVVKDEGSCIGLRVVVSDDSLCIERGDTIWWQDRYAMWSSKDGSVKDKKIARIGYSFPVDGCLTAERAAWNRRELATEPAPDAGGWISVEDRLPEGDGEEYPEVALMAVIDGERHYTEIGSYVVLQNGDQFWCGIAGNYPLNVTHWQPLPSPPGPQPPPAAEMEFIEGREIDYRDADRIAARGANTPPAGDGERMQNALAQVWRLADRGASTAQIIGAAAWGLGANEPPADEHEALAALYKACERALQGYHNILELGLMPHKGYDEGTEEIIEELDAALKRARALRDGSGREEE